jgi:hypothetical protein
MAFNEATRQSMRELNDMRAESWQEFVSELDPRTNTKQVFQVIRKVDGKGRAEHPGTPLEKGTRLLRTDEAKADGFAREYQAVSSLRIPAAEEKVLRPTLKAAKAKECSCADSDEKCVCSPFSQADLHDALGKLKTHKAEGADGVSNEMLRRLGPRAKEALLSVYNKSWLRKEVPTEWRRATIIPILKPHKPPEKPGSYRPISLTSCVGKLMERLVQERTMHLLESSHVLDNNQAGFRGLRSTEDQAVRISQAVSDGFNAKKMKRTVLVLVDFKRAFDTVWKLALYKKMLDLGLPPCYVQWVRQFLSDRYARVAYGVSKSRYYRFEDGLPQGTVLSPLLFLCFINDIAALLPEGVEVSLFADDLALWTQNEDREAAEELMQRALKTLEEWAQKWKLQISIEKTEVTYFTNNSHEAGYVPELKLMGQTLTSTRHRRSSA